MYFDCAHADLELVRDQLVGQAFDHQAHHGALPLGQFTQAGLQQCYLATRTENLGGLCEGLLDPVDQCIV